MWKVGIAALSQSLVQPLGVAVICELIKNSKYGKGAVDVSTVQESRRYTLWAARRSCEYHSWPGQSGAITTAGGGCGKVSR